MALAGKVRNATRKAFAALDDLAGDVTLRRVEASYDPSSGSANNTTTDYTRRAVFDDYSKDELDGQLIQVGDRRVFLLPDSSAPYIPSIGDKIVDSLSTIWEIKRVMPMQPFGEAFAYELQVRK